MTPILTTHCLSTAAAGLSAVLVPGFSLQVPDWMLVGPAAGETEEPWDGTVGSARAGGENEGFGLPVYAPARGDITTHTAGSTLLGRYHFARLSSAGHWQRGLRGGRDFHAGPKTAHHRPRTVGEGRGGTGTREGGRGPVIRVDSTLKVE